LSKKYKIEIGLRAGVKDPQSEAILRTINSNFTLGNGMVEDLTMGKWFVVEAHDDFDIDSLCNKILANSVIEKYTITELD
jgi:phosphoribosylformylglycinamidine synthase subunit PurS|tara:strand:- start:485 stop:724 length:240 start_codon:yes stop_codon:yes gene_type:complete